MPDLRDKLKTLPDFVVEAMSESYKINSEIAQKFGLNEKEIENMVYVIAHTIVGDISLEGFFNSLKERLPNFEETKLKNLALEICYKRFYPLRDYLKGIEDLIKNLGGEIPKDTSLYSEEFKKRKEEKKKKAQKAISYKQEAVSFKAEEKKVKIEKLPLKIAIQKYPKILKQFITAKPIKIKEFDEPVNPTLKNWLSDYLDKMGGGFHNSFERVDYLFNSENGKKLDSVDRNILNSVLKSYDEGLSLPIDQELSELVVSKLLAEINLSPEEVSPEIRGNIINLKNKK